MAPMLELCAVLALFSLFPPSSTHLFFVPFESVFIRHRANKKTDSYGPSSDGIDSFDTLAGLGLGKRSEQFVEEANTAIDGDMARKQVPRTFIYTVHPSKNFRKSSPTKTTNWDDFEEATNYWKDLP